jgi:ABC-2 type transport system permease protein
MRALFGLIKKEFIQVRRDRNMLRIIFVMPIIQLLLFGYVVNTDVKRIALDIYDFDRSVQSREIINSLGAGEYFITNDNHGNILTLENSFKSFQSEMALIIPNQFSKKLARREKSTLGIIVDGTNSNSAGIGTGYASQIIGSFSRDYFGTSPQLTIRHQVLYNPEAESVYFMVPGIVATLLTMLTVMLTSMSVVREREMGTLEQLVVTPISTPVLLLGKLVPFAILGLFEISMALLIGVLWFGIPFAGSPVLLFLLSLVYLVTVLGVGLVFSTVTSTQQQAMFFAWFFSVFALLTSGFFTPIANMPDWMQKITFLNPMRFFIAIVRGIMMKGANFSELWSNIFPLFIYGTLIFSVAALMFAKRTK